MNRGAMVADIARQDVDDIYAARLALELAGVDALASGRDPVAFARLAELTSQIEAAVERQDVTAAIEGDRLFHAALVAATGSARLQRFHARLQQEQRLALSLAERSSRELGRSTDDHRELLDALPAAASRPARRCGRTWRRRRRAAPPPAAHRPPPRGRAG